MSSARHFVYVVNNKEAAAWERSGAVPDRLTLNATYFQGIEPGAVLWLIRVAEDPESDDRYGRSTFLYGRFAAGTVTRPVSGKVQVIDDAGGSRPLQRLKFEPADFKVRFMSFGGALGGFVSSPHSDATDGDSHPGFRSGWRPDVMSVQELEEFWANAQSSKSRALKQPSVSRDIASKNNRKRPPVRTRLEKKPTTGRVLPLKDETDIESLQAACSVTRRRIHNRLTNRVRELFADGFTLDEGVEKTALFDVSIENYNGNGDELFVEVKSSLESADLRMAVGQLYSYWFAVNGKKPPHLAILVPEEPESKVKQWLAWLKIGVLWFSGDALQTSTKSLQRLCR